MRLFFVGGVLGLHLTTVFFIGAHREIVVFLFVILHFDLTSKFPPSLIPQVLLILISLLLRVCPVTIILVLAIHKQKLVSEIQNVDFLNEIDDKSFVSSPAGE